MQTFILALIISVALLKWSMDLYAWTLLKKNTGHGWNPSIKERVKFIFSHARGNNYRFCRRFHAIAKSNRVFFIIYRYWLRLESVVILGSPLIFLGFALLLLLKLVA